MTDQLHDLIGPFTIHGGRIDQACRHFGGGDWLDLSTGISPWPYPLVLAEAGLTRLPSPDDLLALETQAATLFGSLPACTVAVPGSDTGLRLLGHLLGVKAPAVVWPGYAGHRAMWPGGGRLVSADAMADAAGQCDALVLARPGNPGGELPDIDLLAHVAATLAARGGWLIVDEAFADALPGEAMAAQPWPNLVVLRSFGKFYGLAGLRLGFIIAPPALAAGLRALLGDWPISGPALAAGLAALANRDWQAAQRGRLADAGAALDVVLNSAGLAVAARTPYFRTLSVADGWQLFEQLARAAILTRPFADNRQRLRLGLPGNAGDTGRLTAAIDGWNR